MPDISMCQNKECDMRMSCFRYRATPNEFRQSYGMFQKDENGQCDHYSPVTKECGYRLVPITELR